MIILQRRLVRRYVDTNKEVRAVNDTTGDRLNVRIAVLPTRMSSLDLISNNP